MAESSSAVTPEDLEDMIDCAQFGETDDLRTLLAMGCDVNYKDAGGNTALHKAAANGHIDAAVILLEAGAKHVANESGNSPLHWACMNGQKGMVQLLLEKFSDLDVYAKNSFGRSPFTEAIGHGHEEIARQLLEHTSADPSRKGEGASGASAGGAGVGGSGSAAAEGDDEDAGSIEEEEEDLAEEESDLVDAEAAAKEKEQDDAAASASSTGSGSGGAAASSSASSTADDSSAAW
jgi:ankyrin repeat protein